MDILIKTETEKKSNFQVHYEANWPFEWSTVIGVKSPPIGFRR